MRSSKYGMLVARLCHPDPTLIVLSALFWQWQWQKSKARERDSTLILVQRSVRAASIA
ncbi:MAG: hypothetical protein ABI310_01705 [Microbacteriaceae bacterium]